ncbi:MAG: nucleoside-diphosphate kinase [Dehalococcoidia bacterium]|nr:nucleoside-diphosphate kinase [Chloroflexota bacterium]
MSADTQRTLVLIKPDGVQRGLVGAIISRLEARGLKIVAMKMLQMDREMASQHYDVHRQRPFFQGLVEFITTSPIIAVVLEGSNAVELVRRSMGTTDPVQAEPGTIRGDLAVEIGRNLIHGSDSLETAATEISLFFKSEEIPGYTRSVEPWITES